MAATKEIFEQIKNSLDIADIIGEKVRLKPSSRGYTGLCPFHEEKTPSFHVYTDTQSYYCFGCKKAGNIFTFLMEAENLSFSDALKILADRAGIRLPEYEKKSEKGEKDSYEIFELAANFFTENLKNESGVAARKYIERRKLDKSDISRFSLGYSPASWDILVKFLQRKNVSEKQMLNLGLAKQGKHGLYDTFRGRLIFPIKNVTGKVVAFGGRLLDGEGAKYINSSESEIYTKRKNLYMLDVARKSIREKKRSILVEGYMDAIRLHKNGFTETVASCGTSLTSEQAIILSRLADRCYICYDSDKAGQIAAIRGMYILAQNGLDVHVVNLPEGKDPDEFLSSKSPEKFEDLIQNSLPLVVQHIEILRPAIKDSATRKSAMKELFENLAKLDIAEALQYKMQISEVTGVPPSKIEEWFLSKQKQPPAEITVVKANPIEQPYEAGLCALLYHYPECHARLDERNIDKIFRNPIARLTAQGFMMDNPKSMMMLWLSCGETERQALLVRGDEFLAQMKEETPLEKWQVLYNGVRARLITNRIKTLTLKLQNSQATPQEILELKELKSRLQRSK